MTRTTIATIAAIVLLAYGWAGYGIWDFAGRPMP